MTMRLGFTICGECGHVVPASAGFCTICGGVFQEQVILRQVATRPSKEEADLADVLGVAA